MRDQKRDQKRDEKRDETRDQKRDQKRDEKRDQKEKRILPHLGFELVPTNPHRWLTTVYYVVR